MADGTGTGGGIMGQAMADAMERAGHAAATTVTDAGKLLRNKATATARTASEAAERRRRERQRDEDAQAVPSGDAAPGPSGRPGQDPASGVGSFGDAASVRDTGRHAQAFVAERDEALRRSRAERRERRHDAMRDSALGQFLERYNPHLLRRAQAFVRDKEERVKGFMRSAAKANFETTHAAFAHLVTLSPKPMEGEAADRERREWSPLVPGRAEVHELTLADANGTFSMPMAIPADSPAVSDPTNQNVRAQVLATTEIKAAYILMRAHEDGVAIPDGLSDDARDELAGALRAATCCAAGDVDAVRESIVTTMCAARADKSLDVSMPPDVSVDDMAADVTRSMERLPKVLDVQSRRVLESTPFHRTELMTRLDMGMADASDIGRDTQGPVHAASVREAAPRHFDGRTMDVVRGVGAAAADSITRSEAEAEVGEAPGGKVPDGRDMADAGLDTGADVTAPGTGTEDVAEPDIAFDAGPAGFDADDGWLSSYDDIDAYDYDDPEAYDYGYESSSPYDPDGPGGTASGASPSDAAPPRSRELSDAEPDHGATAAGRGDDQFEGGLD